jgi:hypothetical protein
MKKQAWTGLIAATACTLAIGVSAQTTPPAQRPSSPSASDQITVTGCLQRESSSATAGTTGTSGATSASSSASAFVLKVTPPSSPAGSAAAGATTGTAGSTASSYKLDADEAKLTPHIGHKVEITGSVDKSMSSTAPAGSTSAAGGATASAGSNVPKLKVDSVRMIAASCSN